MTFPSICLWKTGPLAVHDMTAHHRLSPSGITHVVLDANILLPPRLSDVLFDLYLVDLFSARWTVDIEIEFLRNWPRVAAGVVSSGLPLTAQQAAAEKAKAEMRLTCYRNAVADYEVLGHKDASVLDRVPDAVDAGDKHVAAAGLVLLDYARQFNVNDKVYIVSSNLKHRGHRHEATRCSYSHAWKVHR